MISRSFDKKGVLAAGNNNECVFVLGVFRWRQMKKGKAIEVEWMKHRAYDVQTTSDPSNDLTR